MCNNISANLGSLADTIQIDMSELFPFAEVKENGTWDRGWLAKLRVDCSGFELRITFEINKWENKKITKSCGW